MDMMADFGFMKGRKKPADLETIRKSVRKKIWVMDSFYKLDKKQISEKMTNVYRTAGIVVLNGEILPDALAVYVDKNIDFTDAVIGAIAARNHIEHLASFDKKHVDRLSDLGIQRVESPEEILQCCLFPRVSANYNHPPNL